LLTLDIGGDYRAGPTGLYPYVGCKFDIDIDNDGTVPAHLAIESNVIPANGAPPAGDIGVISTLNAALTSYGGSNGQALCTALGTMLDGSATVNTANHLPDIGGTPAVQLHHGEKITCDVIVYLKEVAPERTMWSYSWELIAHQWNEAVGPSNQP
jgi:hypothetical protein